jgi:hypothetical protein
MRVAQSYFLHQLLDHLPRTESPDGAGIKRKLLEQVEAAIDRELGQLRPGQGLGIVFRLEIIYSDNSFASDPDARNSPEALAWTRAVMERDGFCCRACGAKGRLHAHHVNSWAEHPGLRFELSNGVTLCLECHAQVHPERKALILASKRRKGHGKGTTGQADTGGAKAVM